VIPSLLSATLDELRGAHSWRALEAGVPESDGWLPFAAVVRDETVLRAWFDDFLAGEAKGQKDVAGSYLSSYLSSIVVEPVVDAVLALGRAWPTVAGNLLVRRHEQGWFDGLAIATSEVYVLSDDPRASDPDAHVLADLDELVELVTMQIAELFEPVFGVVRGLAPFGVRGMWGAVADGIGAGTLWSVRARRQGDAVHEWQRAMAMTDRLAGHAPRLKVRPDIERVEWEGGGAHVSVKGTCCLYYKVHDGDLDPDGDGYCTGCPKRSVASRHARWVGFLREPDRESR
jgi:hypothetical protein